VNVTKNELKDFLQSTVVAISAGGDKVEVTNVSNLSFGVSFKADANTPKRVYVVSVKESQQ
jgi:hypothetical protein